MWRCVTGAHGSVSVVDEWGDLHFGGGEAGVRRSAAVQHTRPGRQDRRVASSEPVAELGLPERRGSECMPVLGNSCTAEAREPV